MLIVDFSEEDHQDVYMIFDRIQILVFDIALKKSICEGKKKLALVVRVNYIKQLK